MKKVIFTVLIGNYDTLQKAPNVNGWDSILFTDLDLPDHKGWTVIKVKSEDPKKDSRKYKWLSHYFLPDYDLVCYIDANMTFRTPPNATPIWHKHHRTNERRIRKTIRQEMDHLIATRKESAEMINAQWNFYTANGFMDDIGLFENGFFIRRHTESINELHNMVWKILKKFSYRDQIALPFAIHITNTYPENIVPGINLRAKVHILQHQPSKLPDLTANVHHITPGRADKNLGKAINQLIEHLPENDWICLRDIDTVPTNHTSFFKQCEDIARANEFDLIGCMSNRIGLHTQLHKSTISDETDYMVHKAIGQELFEKHGSKVIPTVQTIAGQFMLFSKRTWSAVGGFPEGGIRLNNKFIDYWFSSAVRRQKMKLGVAIGIYLFHDYRLGKGNPKGNIHHLVI